MTRPEKIGRARRLLFHLAKAFWKAVPGVGPFVDELALEQFKPFLLGESADKAMSGLSDEQLDQLIAALPSQEGLEELEDRATRLTWEQRLQIARGHADMLNAMARGFIDVNAGLTRIESVLQEIGEAVASDEEVRIRLSDAEQKRVAWIQRISASQLQLLSSVPRTPAHVRDLLERARKDALPECTELEFRFRLHELEWLGLVSRRKAAEGGDWLYWRPSGR